MIRYDKNAWLLETRQWLPEPPVRLFDFFADAHNLERITPAWLNFTVLTPPPVPMFEGQVICYRLKLHGMPIRWRSIIRDWQPPYRFVDEQARGPYKRWQHTHTFEARDGGTLITDHVRYLPRGGRLIHRLIVRPDLEQIFRFRRDALRSIFHAPDDREPGA